MHIRTPLILAATAACAVAGCSSTDATTARPAATIAGPTSTTAPATTAPATTAPATTAPATTAPAGTASTTAKPAADTGCPVSEATLLRALRASDVAKALAPTKTLSQITCYKGYALGLTHPSKADDAEVVFHYQGGAWRAVNGGTAEYCDDVVPAAVRPHLEHC